MKLGSINNDSESGEFSDRESLKKSHHLLPPKSLFTQSRGCTLQSEADAENDDLERSIESNMKWK